MYHHKYVCADCTDVKMYLFTNAQFIATVQLLCLNKFVRDSGTILVTVKCLEM